MATLGAAMVSRVEEIEIHLFIEAMRLRYGYDFSQYARASLKRRVLGLRGVFGHEHVSQLLPRLLHDDSLLPQVIAHLSVPVTEMFRDPAVFRVVRGRVVPLLRSYPTINVWQAGCATGEEVYSLAILLQEEGLYERARIYATDINDIALAKAEEGVFAEADIRHYAANHRNAGGTGSLLDYFHIRYGFAKVDDPLRRNIVFAHHNLVSDGVFCDFNLILCRNVLIYFDRGLQGRVLQLFRDSLVRGGFLCLGTKESLDAGGIANQFQTFAKNAKLFQVVPDAGMGA